MHNPSHFLHNQNLVFKSLSSRSSIRDRERHAKAVRFAKMAPTCCLHNKIDCAKFVKNDHAKFMQNDNLMIMQNLCKIMQIDYAKSKTLSQKHCKGRVSYTISSWVDWCVPVELDLDHLQ